MKIFKIIYSNSLIVIGIFCCLIAIYSLDILHKEKKISPLESNKRGYEVFGFAPFWTLENLDNVNFDLLTTLAYFGVPIKEDGNLDKEDIGYVRFQSNRASEIFKKAHDNNTRVVLTITLMDNDKIKELLDSKEAQKRTISQSTQLVKERGIDGINVDVEYDGDPGGDYKDKFSVFVEDISKEMHRINPNSKVTVSVYASAVKYPKLYDIISISETTDGIFMMAYDFATTGSDYAMPTAPLKGHKEGKYWYDIDTAVNDFLTQMPADKLILGVPYYGYNYSVEEPSVKASTMSAYYWNSGSITQTYSAIKENVNPEMDGASEFKTGWDNYGKVSWKAYYKEETGIWRMVFNEDKKSLGLKYDFAKEKKLAGVGIWALGFDDGHYELWDLLNEKFGGKIAKAAMR